MVIKLSLSKLVLPFDNTSTSVELKMLHPNSNVWVTSHKSTLQTFRLCLSPDKQRSHCNEKSLVKRPTVE
jgi:hypothetical protein